MSSLRPADKHRYASSAAEQDFVVSVAAPPIPEAGRRYPVLYLPDSQGTLGLARELIHVFQAVSLLPELIVVGVGYPIGDIHDDEAARSEWFDLRFRDLVPVELEDGRGGHAAEYLRFLTDELMPFVNERYPTDTADVAIRGASLGGLFALYALFRAPEHFNRYIASSPAIQRADSYMWEAEARLAEQRDELPVRVVISAGALEPEPMIGNAQRMAAALEGRGYRGFDLRHRVFENENHLSVVPAALSSGLLAAFGDLVGE